MSEKSVIIDGVDVSECEYFQEDGGENTCRAEEDYTGTVVCCSACDNCYYKQLKRLQQENEIQKKELCQRYEEPEFATFRLMGKTAKEWQNIQKENERLKEENKQLEKEVETWNYQADKRAELSNIWFNTAETYKQALREIREIAEYSIMHNANLNSNYQLILQIITKAKEENE